MNSKNNEHGIFNLEYQKQRKGNKISKNLCHEMVDFLPKDQIIYDLGCGTAEYLEFLFYRDFRVTGFEGTKGINEITDVPVIERDLTVLLPIPNERGSVLCIEVAEHIPVEYEQTLIDNIDLYTKDYAIVSWALPGQGGIGHVNERPASYVIEQFRKRGYIFDEGLSLKWRKSAESDLPWLANTIYVFQKIQ